jgi:hypothetical protein
MFGSGVRLVSRTDQLNPGSPGHSAKTPPGTDSFPQIVVAPSGRSSEICAAHAAAGGKRPTLLLTAATPPRFDMIKIPSTPWPRTSWPRSPQK